MRAVERKRLHRILKLVVAMTVLLVGVAIYLGISTARHMKSILKDQFNDQQLVLARATAMKIESNLQNAIADLALLNSLPAIQYSDAEAYEVILLSTLPVLNRDHIIEIRRIDSDGNTMFVVNDQGLGMKHFGLVQQEAGAYLSWAAELNNRGKTMGTGIRLKDLNKGKRLIVFDLLIPTYEDSVDQYHPRASRRFAGYLRATVDVSRLLQQLIPQIRSGRGGYAWVLDSSGCFLYHPESSFIGEDAFEVRANRNPAISFAKINQIQRNEMLRGKEGVGTYISGWHRDVIEPMEKLIAYTPVRIQGPYIDYVWSVAVVAPLQEIEGTIGSVYDRQVMLQGIIILVILFGSLVVVLYELRWSTYLEYEVALKTEDICRTAGELERSEARYRSLIESAEDLIYSLNGDGVISMANHHMYALFGVSEGELVGQSLYKFLPKDQADEQVRLIRQVLRSGKGQRAESLLKIQDSEFWFNIQYLPLRGEDEDFTQILGIARDITERKSLEKQLINTEKLASLGTLAAGVAHEINNPLGIMLGFCDLLLEKMEPGTMEHNDLKTIERHGLHCKSIVERLLSFARISEEAEEECNVNENVDSILSVVKHTLHMNNIRLNANLCEELPRVCFDSRGLQQVLLNLISNALYAMNGEGVLTVESRPGADGETVELLVTDTGCGIRKELMGKIFDPFFTTKKVGDGTGLGLSVSYGIITKHGGTIECVSHTARDGLGRTGTTFTIRLPVSREGEAEPGTDIGPSEMA
ncbi:MAG: ATP-binding protein [Syntrophobacteraceae bacterium]|nr:PAS domain S-box protein [Desulfobacteraceae bacterium]